MLDIIIPTYKNKEGLRQTLSSINTELLSEITITVIDDCSNMHYNDILEEFPFFTIFYMPQNSGPGMVRQTGIEITHEPYITFIDTNDTFVSNEMQQVMIDTIKQYPDIPIFSWQHKIGDKISKNTNNRMHGRVYKRSFIEQYNISFCPESSYTNEDIGFNRLCRLIIADKNITIAQSDEAVINYNQDKNSITNRNNHEFFYNQQNMGLALNVMHVIKIAEKDKLSKETISNEVATIMVGLYYGFLCTKYERPEFIQNAWDGAYLFYHECFSHYLKYTSNFVFSAYGQFMKNIYNRAKNWKNFKPCNLMRFLKDIENYKEVPSWYLI